MIDNVFDPFVSTKRDGVGLGLVNAKAVLEAHGGRIRLGPRAQEARVRRSGFPPRTKRPRAPGTADLREHPWLEILVVDDDQSIATAFERFLRHEGHACMVASNAEDAVRMVGERDPDLVVMDIRMPGVDGLQALQQLRSKYPDLYVVMMTAYGTSQTSIDAIRSGAFEVPDQAARSQPVAHGHRSGAGGRNARASARSGRRRSHPLLRASISLAKRPPCRRSTR